MTLFQEYMKDPVVMELFTFTASDLDLYDNHCKKLIAFVARSIRDGSYERITEKALWEDYVLTAAKRYIFDYIEKTTKRKRIEQLLIVHFPEYIREKAAAMLSEHYEDEINEWRE